MTSGVSKGQPRTCSRDNVDPLSTMCEKSASTSWTSPPISFEDAPRARLGRNGDVIGWTGKTDRPIRLSGLTPRIFFG
jgi:hypothetical protein